MLEYVGVIAGMEGVTVAEHEDGGGGNENCSRPRDCPERLLRRNANTAGPAAVRSSVKTAFITKDLPTSPRPLAMISPPGHIGHEENNVRD
ncbi:hypothetical protein dqs_2270 [Azoarcus olearius]|nr:hypothetical protein dqs_2270 [Azoarcus olearius]